MRRARRSGTRDATRARGIWRVAAIAAIAVVGLLSCGRSKNQEIVFWQCWPVEVVDPLIARFQQEHPGTKVRVEQIPWQGGLERITAAIDSGTVPDLCELGSTWMPQLLGSGSLADWSAGVADLKASLTGWQLCSIGDAAYGLPWVTGTRALFYNKTLFARAGLDSTRPPVTWDELRDAAERIQRLGGNVHGYGVQAGEPNVLFKKFMPFAWSNGGRILSDDLSASAFDSWANVTALEFYLQLRPVGLLERQEVLDREFKEGRLGMQISGGWLFKSIPRDAPGLRYGVALVPRPDLEHGTHASFAGGEVLASFRESKRKQAALELARFLVRPENARHLAQAVMSVQPATLGSDTSAYYRDHPGEQTMIRQFETSVPTPNHRAWSEMEAAIEHEVAMALDSKKSAAQAVADAHRRLNELARKN